MDKMACVFFVCYVLLVTVTLAVGAQVSYSVTVANVNVVNVLSCNGFIRVRVSGVKSSLRRDSSKSLPQHLSAMGMLVA